MARYAEWNKFIGNLKTDKYGETNVNEVGIAFEKATADVAPKSEVERLNAVMKEMDDQRAYTINMLGESLEKAKSEVERLKEEANRYKRYFFRHDYYEMIAEVLDKLDRFINSNCIEIKDERGIKGYVTSGVHFAIAELKKEYTEGEI